MKTYGSLGRSLLVIWLSLSLGACLMDSRTDGGWTDAGTAENGISLAITAPTSSAEMDTTDESVALGGTAGSARGIAQVSWRNDRGGQGNASGRENWQTTSIALELGKNTITVTAENNAGETHSRRITVNRESGQTGSATLSWDAPTTRTDGTPLQDLAGYAILYGRMSGTYDYRIDVDNPGVLTYVVENLVPGEWYFALIAYDADGTESDYSNEVTRTIS